MCKLISHIDEIKIGEKSRIIGKEVGEIGFKLSKILLVGIQKDSQSEFLFNPKPDRVIEEGDTLVMMGQKISIEYFKEGC